MPERSWITEVVLDIAKEYRGALKEKDKARQEIHFMEERLSKRINKSRLDAMTPGEVKAYREQVGTEEILKILEQDEAGAEGRGRFPGEE